MVSTLVINSSDEAVNAITSLEEWALLKKENFLKTALDELSWLIKTDALTLTINKKLIEVSNSLDFIWLSLCL